MTSSFTEGMQCYDICFVSLLKYVTNLTGCSQASSPEGLNRRTGTPVFMAPEVYARKYGMPADLWSCGIMMYQLLAGRFPFWCGPRRELLQVVSFQQVRSS